MLSANSIQTTLPRYKCQFTRLLLASAFVMFGAPVFAQRTAPDVPLPVQRPDKQSLVQSFQPTLPSESGTVALPQRRPKGETTSASNDDNVASGSEERMSEDRVNTTKPQRIYQSACPAVLMGKVVAKILPPIAEGRCQLRSPYLVTGVQAGGNSVAFSSPGTTNCEMATQLQKWIAGFSAYTQSVFNSPIARIETGTSYACRPRNNSPDADLSEHGFGNALDITGFELEDGRTLILPDHWDDDSAESRAMRQAHGSACGHFTTVLGPDANALHADHFHIDLGCHGSSCTYRLCE